MKFCELGGLAAFVIVIAARSTCAQSFELYVSPDGDDAASGTFASPFKTPIRARNFIRELKKNRGVPSGGVTVWLRGGVYRMKETLQLNAADSGQPGAPIVWSAWRNERPIFDGSIDVPPLRRVSDAAALERLPACAREHVRCVDLRAAGFEGLADAAPTCGRDASDRANSHPVTDLYEDGKRLTVAEEPNEGWYRHSGGHSSNMTVRTELDGGDWTRWTHEPDLMVKGYTSWCWTLLTAEVTNLDPEKKTFAFGGDLDFTHQYKGRFIDNQAFKFVNALCALDRPGEWFIDRHSGILYVWPQGGKLVLSQFSKFFLRADEAHDLVFRGLTFQCGRDTAIGSWKSVNVTFERNTIRRFGRSGLWSECTCNLAVRNNVFEAFGDKALSVTGGDCETLTESGNVVEGNEFADGANRIRCPLLQIGTRGRTDCGTRVIGNRFRDTQGSAICAMSVNLLVMSNTVERCVLREEDEGAFDTGGDPTFLGIRIIDNVWRDIGVELPGQPRKHAEMLCGQAAVRLDDAISMVEIRGNYFVNCGSADFGAVNINSGRRNRVVGNVFENCNRKITGGNSVYPVPDGAWWNVWNPKKERSCKFRERISREPYKKAFPGVETLPDESYWYEDRENVEVGPRTEIVPPTVPQAVTNDWWQARHCAKLAHIAANQGRRYDFVFIGDSIVHDWEEPAHLASWKAAFEDHGLTALNLGFRGDCTEHVLWRLENGELDGYPAENVVLMIGTNDSTLGRPANVIAQGIRGCVKAIRARQPEARVILHPIFPRGFNGYQYHRQHEWQRKRNDLASSMVRGIADGDRIIWCDFNAKWTPEGWGVSPDLMPDGMHPSAAGYRLWRSELQKFSKKFSN